MHTELFESFILFIPVATRKLFWHQWLVNSDSRKDKVIWIVANFIIWHFSVNRQKRFCNRKRKFTSIWLDYRSQIKSNTGLVYFSLGALPLSLSRLISKVYIMPKLLHHKNKSYKTNYLIILYNSLLDSNLLSPNLKNIIVKKYCKKP